MDETFPLGNCEELSFTFTRTDAIYLAGTDEKLAWQSGEILPFQNLSVSPAAAVFSYGQAVFEGMKAFRTSKGEVVLFRPEMNALRFQRSAKRLLMPPYPTEQFVAAVKAVVNANRRWVPPCEGGLLAPCSLYIRPVLMGSGAVLGVRAAPSYTFFIYVSPAGRYLPGQGHVVVLDEFHRVPPGGTGEAKAAGNYAGTLLPHEIAVERGFKDALYLDAVENRYIEELGSSNFFALLPGGHLVTPPLAGSILAGVTRDSILTLAREELHLRVEEHPLALQEVLDSAVEAFFTGTAAVVQPITSISYNGKESIIGSGEEGAITRRLRELLVAVQTGQAPDPHGWRVIV
jgi:branched-chain amino acid aminotransferase